MPVPLQRNNANRRNEYVNMPVSLQSVSSHPMPAVSTDIQSVSSASPDLSNPHGPPFGGGGPGGNDGPGGRGEPPFGVDRWVFFDFRKKWREPGFRRISAFL